MEDNSKIRDHWLAGELAKETSVSTDTLRHYERKGVLKFQIEEHKTGDPTN